MASGYAAAREAIDKLLADVGGLLADLTSAETPDSDAEAEDARRVIDAQVSKFWQGYYELKRRHDESALSVAVLALTKSGKSTLLNSLMGMHVLPMNNVPETARITRIQHDPAAKEPTLREGAAAPAASSGSNGSGSGAATAGGGWGGRGRSRGSGEGVVVRGEAAVRARLQQLNSAARTSSGPLSPRPSGGLGLGLGADAAGGSGGSGRGGEQQQQGLLPEGLDELLAVGGGAGGAAAAPVGPPASSSVLHITAPLMGLEGWGAEMGRVCLLDTPGPNEAGEEQLKHQVERLLEGVDCVLYLLDYTKLKTAEEEGLFRRLRAINPQLVARLSSRLFFIVNKVDACETSEGLDPDQVREYVADLVTRQLGASSGGAGVAAAAAGGSAGAAGAGAGPGGGHGGGGDADVLLQRSASAGAGSDAGTAPFRLHPDQVLLLSARNALLARLVLSGRAGPEDLKRFHRLAFGAFGGMGMGMGLGRGPAAAGPSAEAVRAAAGCLLEGSGVCELEGRVLSFLAAHAGAVKLLATADDLTRLLGQVRNVALACRSCLQRNVAVLTAQAEGLRAELAEAAAAFEEVRGRADAVQTEVVGEIKSHLNTLRRRLFTQIVQTLDTDAHAPPPAVRSSGRWYRVRDKFLSMFTAASSSLPPGSGPSPLVPQARSRSRDELAALLLDLHDDLMSQIHSEVSDFWGVLEACAASRHAELLSALNTHLAALSRRVEGAVSEALEVRLDPADIRLRPPSAEELHSDVAALIEKGIRESNEKHIRVGTRTTTERVFRQPAGPPSLCRWGGYWVDVPKTRTVVETYNATVYCLRPDEIANHFIGLVDGAVSASEAALGAYVAALVEAQLAAARERIREYGDRYLDAMNAALAVSARGAHFRGAALAAVDGYLTRLEALTARAAAAQAGAEAAVPGAAAGLMDEVEVYEDLEEEEERREEQERQELEEGLAAAAPPPPPELHELEAAEAAAAAAAQVDLLLPEDSEEEPEAVLKEEVAPGDAVAAAGAGVGADGEEEEQEERVRAQPVAAATDVLGAALEAELEALYGGGGAAGGSGGGAAHAGESHEEQMRQLSAALSAAMADSVFMAPAVAAAAETAAETAAAPAAEPELAAPEAAVAAAAADGAEAVIPDIDDLALDEEEVISRWPPMAQSGQGSEMVLVAAEEEQVKVEEVKEPAEAPEQLRLQEEAPAVEAVAEAEPEVAREAAAAPAEPPVPPSSLPAAPSMSSSTYTGAPFDYSRAFIEVAMSSSEMGASLAPAAAAASAEDALTMIPLTCAEDAARARAAGAGGGGADSPRSAASSGDWQLVGAAGEEELDVAEGEPAGPAVAVAADAK